MLVHELAQGAAERRPDALALIDGGTLVSYSNFVEQVERASKAFLKLGLGRGQRVAVWLDKRREAVVAMFGAAAAGAAFVPINPVLKPDQVAHIVADSEAAILVTSPDRAKRLGDRLEGLAHLRHVVSTAGAAKCFGRVVGHEWNTALAGAGEARPHRVIETDLAAIFYTSGSTGNPKGVALSHRNIVAGAISVAEYLPITQSTRVGALLPLSFDAGFSQLTTSFVRGGSVLLVNYVAPAPALSSLADNQITALTAVPPLWAQLLREPWPAVLVENMQFAASTGGSMPRALLEGLRLQLPRAQIFLMYGLTEAFRSTYLPPDQVTRRPNSIGKAIPNNEILVLRPDGTRCAPMEHGELVHRGPNVALGYWNDPCRTAERFKPLPQPSVRESGFPIPEIAVFSGDTGYMDREGYLYFVGRYDDMIKTSGYRVSPTEIEQVVLETGLVSEAAAVGTLHAQVGQEICVVAQIASGYEGKGEWITAEIGKACRKALPAFMQPHRLDLRSEALPRNPNGKIDRLRLRSEIMKVES